MNPTKTQTRKHRNGSDITAEYYYGTKPDNCRFLAPGEVIQKGDSAYSCGQSKYIDCAASIGRTVDPTDDKIYIRCEGDPGWRILGESEIVRATDEYRYGKDRRGDWEFIPAKDRIGCPAGPACVYRRATPEPAQTEAAHTPGPWIVDDRHIHAATGLTYPRGIEPETDVIVQVDTDCHERGLLNATDAANLRLIAAAPDGLAFALSFLDWCAQLRSIGRTLPGMEAREREAQGFITKATGASSQPVGEAKATGGAR